MGVKMNFRKPTKNHANDSQIGSPQKIDFRAVRTHESHPTACELRPKVDVGEIFRLFGCKMSARKLIELNWTHESPPTA